MTDSEQKEGARVTSTINIDMEMFSQMRTDQIETVLIKKMREEKSNSKFWGNSPEERKSCNSDKKSDQ